MSLLGGLNPVSLLATAALGPLGGIAAQLVQQVVSQVGQQLIQNMGQELGLPQSAIDMAQGAFCGAMGDVQGSAQNADEAIEQLGQELNASPSEIGEAQGQTDRTMDDILAQLNESSDVKEAKAGGKGGGWLLAMAKALGGKLDGLANKMEAQAKDIDTGKPSASQEFTVTTQQFSILMNATNNGLKSVGDAMANAARKQ